MPFFKRAEEKQMAETMYIVGKNAPLGLFLRSAPDKTKEANKLAVLPMGTEVSKLADSGVAGWWQVSARLDGVTLIGYVNGNFLTKLDSQGISTLPHAVSSVTPVHLITDKSI